MRMKSTPALLLAATLIGQAAAQQTATPPAPADAASVTVAGLKHASPWFKAESQHFVVYSDTRHEDVSELLNNLERLDFVLRLYTRDFLVARNAPQKMTLYYHASDVSFKAATPDQPEEAVALYNSCGAGVQGFGLHLERVPGMTKEQLAKHPLNNTLTYAFEAYARHFLYRNTDIRTPSFYVDGFAQYFSTLRFADGQMSVGRVPASVARLFYFLNQGHRYRMQYADILQLNGPPDPDGDPAERLEFLAKSWLLTHYMMGSIDNQAKRDAYLNLVHRDVAAGPALETAFGLKMSDLDTTMWRYRLNGIEVKQFDMPELPSAQVNFTMLPDALTDFLLADAALKSCPDQKSGQALLRAVSQHPGGIPNNDAARLTVSRAQIDWGNAADALPYLTEAVRKNSANFQATYLLGLANLRLAGQQKDAAHRKAAAEHLARAQTLDPKSAEAAFAAYQLQISGGEPPSQQTLDAAIAAWRNAHEVGRYARVAALAYAYRGWGPEADNAFTVLAHNARDPELAKWAQDWQRRMSKGVSRDDVVAEMRREPDPQATFKEWTVAGEILMQTVEYNAGIEDTRKYLEGLRMADPMSEKNQFALPTKR